MIKQILLSLKNEDIIGIYRFRNNDFVVGNILKILDNYLFLNSYDTNGENNGIKILLLNSIERVVLYSSYIEKLKKNKQTKKSIIDKKNLLKIFIKLL